MADQSKGSPGVPVDYRGGLTVDPTKNVLDLVAASDHRQNDLRIEAVKRIEDRIIDLDKRLELQIIEGDRRLESLLLEADKRFNMQIAEVESSLSTVNEHYKELLSAHIIRYEQRHAELQTYFEQSIQSRKDAVRDELAVLREAMTTALANAERAVSKAETANEKRFEGVNEFRAQLGDQQRTLMPRAEAENRLGVLMDKITVLENFRTETLTKGTAQKEGYGLAVGVVGIIVAVISILSAAAVMFSKFGS